MALTLLLGACGTAQIGSKPTSVPEVTKAPAATATPVPKLYYEEVDEALRIYAENGLELRAHTLLWADVYGDYKEVGLTPSYVKLAFRVEDDVLKEFGIRDQVSLSLNEVNAFSFPEIMISLVNYINSDGKVCDGVGMQAHLSNVWPGNANDFIKGIKRYLAEGFEI